MCITLLLISLISCLVGVGGTDGSVLVPHGDDVAAAPALHVGKQRSRAATDQRWETGEKRLPSYGRNKNYENVFPNITYLYLVYSQKFRTVLFSKFQSIAESIVFRKIFIYILELNILYKEKSSAFDYIIKSMITIYLKNV